MAIWLVPAIAKRIPLSRMEFVITSLSRAKRIGWMDCNTWHSSGVFWSFNTSNRLDRLDGWNERDDTG